MNRLFLRGLGLVLLGGCASSAAPPWILPHHEPAEPQEKVADARVETDLCPTETTEVDPAQCADLPDDYGLSPEHSVEWGVYAARGNQRQVLYFQRLLCADGTSAFATRLETSLAPRASSSPPSQLGARSSDSELLDHWKVECGAEAITLYSNIRRCGSPCVPKVFRLMSAKGAAARERGYVAEKEGRLDDFYAAAREARDADPGAVAIQRTYIYSYLIQERFEDSLQAAEEALAHIPDNDDLRSYRLVSLMALERWAEADPLADELLERIEGTSDRNLGTTLCLKAKLAKELGRADEVPQLRERACAAGSEPCCAPGAEP